MFVYIASHITETVIRTYDLAGEKASHWILPYKKSKRRPLFIIMIFQFVKKSKSVHKWMNLVWKNWVNWAPWTILVSFRYAHWPYRVSIEVGRNYLHILNRPWRSYSSLFKFYGYMLLNASHTFEDFITRRWNSPSCFAMTILRLSNIFSSSVPSGKVLHFATLKMLNFSIFWQLLIGVVNAMFSPW